MGNDGCKHVWIMKAHKIFKNNIPDEGRVIVYCPLCKMELSTKWVKFSIVRTDVNPYDSSAVDVR
jgi:hypothetical protein